jgi:hypothetical protein
MLKSLGLAVLVISFPAAAAAADNAGKPARDGEQIVCKSQARANSRLPKKTCMTKEQWEDMAEQNKRDAKEMIDRPQIEIRRD